MALRGIYHVNMDTKGRLALPARLRDRLPENNSLVVTIDPQNKCLLVYPVSEWENFENKLNALPSLNKAVRRFQRLVLGYASDIDLDGNGRMLLPSALREYSDLQKKIVVIGQAKRLEIWSESLWLAERDLSLEEVANGDLELPDEMLSLSL
jgi:MraZ protein